MYQKAYEKVTDDTKTQGSTRKVLKENEAKHYGHASNGIL